MDTYPSGKRLTAIGVGLLALDLITKWATATLWAGHDSGLITPARNHNLALGSVSLQDGLSPAIVVVLVLASGFFVASIVATLTRRIHPLGLVLLLSGAAGNALDRAVTGAVHDWLNLYVVIANVADVVLLVGLVLLLRAFWVRSETL